MATHRIMQTTLHDSPRTLDFCVKDSYDYLLNSDGITPTGSRNARGVGTN